MGAPSIAKRFAEAKAAFKHGVTTAIYLRPVIPGVTIKQIDSLIEQILVSGIKYITVGGLYVDDRIIVKLKKYSIPTLFEFQSKKHVLDQRGLLQKVADDDTDKIVELLRKSGLTTFRSSMDLVRYFQAEI
jgi:DNA repair photolyase